MEKTTRKPTALLRKMILIIPFCVIAIAWLFSYVHRFIFGWVLLASSAAFILALIPNIFIRPFSGGKVAKALRVTARCLLFFVLTAVISLQCFAGIVFFWLAD